jgi:capsid protein
MALSDQQKKDLRDALADQPGEIASKLADAVKGSDAIKDVAAISSSNLVGVDGAGSNAAPLAETETRLDALEAKVNAILAALKA